MRRIVLFFAAAAIAAAATACSGLRKQQAQQLAEADAQFTRGCYSCLRKAFDTYDTLRLAGYQPAVTSARAFDTALILAAREKELAMEADGWIKKAEERRPDRLRQGYGGPPGTAKAEGLRYPVYLEIVRALPWAIGRLDRDQQPDMRPIGPVLDALDKWDAALGPAPARGIVATYLMAAARCAFTPARDQESLTFERLAPVHAGAPLMKYIAGSCRPELRSHLDALASDADFHEVAFQRGRLRLYQGGAAVHLEARTLLETAHAAMPDAVAAAYLLAGVLSALEEYEACAAMYDEVVTRGGAKRESMLNRTVCLTHAKKRPEAIRSASDLIDSPGILRSEAYFWRAWNQYHAKNLPDARADIEESKKLYREADVYALSGFIAYDMNQKPYAYTEFGEAYRRSSQYCVAPFYQGLIDSEKDQWPPAVERYLIATSCYEASVRRLENDLRAVERLEADNPTRERRIENLTVAVNAEKLQLARASYNVAYSFGRSGEPAKGVRFAEQAGAAHKDLQKLAAELLAILRKSG